jgi:hypothetical protein
MLTMRGEEGYGWSTQHIQWSQLGFTHQSQILQGVQSCDKTEFSVQLFCDWEDDKAVFLFSATRLLPEISVLIESAAALFQSATPLFKAHPSVKVLKPLNILKVLV